MKKNMVWAAVVGLLILSLSITYFAAQYQYKAPRYVKDYGEYQAGIVGSENNGLCMIEKIWKSGSSHRNSLLVVRLCENNLDSIMTNGDWVVVKTSCGDLMKNLKTGEEQESKVIGFCGTISFVN